MDSKWKKITEAESAVGGAWAVQIQPCTFCVKQIGGLWLHMKGTHCGIHQVQLILMLKVHTPATFVRQMGLC